MRGALHGSLKINFPKKEIDFAHTIHASRGSHGGGAFMLRAECSVRSSKRAKYNCKFNYN
jgi:hypothetical protein